MEMQKIVTLTVNPAIDKSAEIDHVAADRKLRCEAPRHEPGGGGINVSRAIRRLGGNSLALYPAGGTLGQMLDDLLDQEKVNYRSVSIEGMTRENLTVFEKSDGRQFRFGMPGPTLREEEWQCCLDELAKIEPKPAYIIASGSLPPGVPQDFYARVASLGKDSGSRVVVDSSGEALSAAARAGVYLLKPNMRELAHLAGHKIESELEQERVAQDLITNGNAEVVVVSLGAAGALLASAIGLARLRAPTVKIVSKIGAGDSMVAGIVLALVRGENLENAVRFGIAAGAAAVMTPGTELCRREDAEKLYERILAGEE
jgi:6-phosphofructokinase 2